MRRDTNINLKQSVSKIFSKNEDEIRMCLKKQILREFTKQTFPNRRYIFLILMDLPLISCGSHSSMGAHKHQRETHQGLWLLGIGRAHRNRCSHLCKAWAFVLDHLTPWHPLGQMGEALKAIFSYTWWMWPRGSFLKKLNVILSIRGMILFITLSCSLFLSLRHF